MKFVQSKKMTSSNYNEGAASLMGRPKGYDDSHLRKRVTCLTSTILVCFLLAAASLGVSIIVLIKYDGTLKTFPEILGNQTKAIAELKNQMKSLQQQQKVLEKMNIDGDQTILLEDDVGSVSDDFVKSKTMVIGLDGIQIEERLKKPSKVNGLDGIQIEEKPHQHPKMNGLNEIQIEERPKIVGLNGIKIEERLKMNELTEQGEKHPHDHSKMSELTGKQIEERHHEQIEEQPTIDLDEIQIEERLNSEEMQITEESLNIEDKSYNAIKELLCDDDDSDMCQGSGSGDSISTEDDDDYEGSGFESNLKTRLSNCPQFAVPVCPVGVKICFKLKNNCSVPICCPTSSHDHHH